MYGQEITMDAINFFMILAIVIMLTTIILIALTEIGMRIYRWYMEKKDGDLRLTKKSTE